MTLVLSIELSIAHADSQNSEVCTTVAASALVVVTWRDRVSTNLCSNVIYLEQRELNNRRVSTYSRSTLIGSTPVARRLY
jgi:hypothetical protein